MRSVSKPSIRPNNPNFSSGPCSKRPGWSLDVLRHALVGRSHRSEQGIAKILEVLNLSRHLLEIPDDYQIAMVPGSDTGAFEMAMWSLLGRKPVTVIGWENFGFKWFEDAENLALDDCQFLKAPYGLLPDLSTLPPNRDLVFTWNGTTSGVCVPDGEWIDPDRSSLTLCDATSAAFAMHLPWDKLDVTTYSWQKCLGGEAAHGMLILSPRAIERLETAAIDRPVPYLFQLSKKGRFNTPLIEGVTINTPSMLCIEDALDALRWGYSIGGLQAMIERCQHSLRIVSDWVDQTSWIDFLAQDPKTRACTSICLKITDPLFTKLSTNDRAQFIKTMTTLLEQERVAFDIKSHQAAPPGLRIWGGVTVESADIQTLLPWIEWAFFQTLA